MEGRLQRLLHRTIEPQILFPLSAVVTLLLIWGGTFSYVRMQRADLEVHSRESTHQILETYEAQVIRSLSEIEKAMDLVTWWRGQSSGNRIEALSERQLLPPDLVFGISVADVTGRIVDSNRPGGVETIAQTTLYTGLRGGEPVIVGQPQHGDAAGSDSTLQFGRRLETSGGEFDGAVIVEVDARYFVSGYEEGILGQHGLLAMIGSDGALRVLRSGDRVKADGSMAFSALRGLTSADTTPTVRRLTVGEGGDRAERWIATRELFAFPLWVAVGLSVNEQFAALEERVEDYYWLAGFITVTSLVALAWLGRMSLQLMRSREREVEIRQAHAERVEHLAYHDGLTGLANRSLFSKLLSQSLNEGARYDRRLAVIYLDLDRFKPINDTLGHEAGDDLLREVAQRLRGCVRTSDTVARLGGDEFVVLVPQVQGDDELALIAGKILEAVGRPAMLRGHEVRVTASVGIAISPRDGSDEQTLKKNADAAMYQAKARGKNNFQFYTDQLSTTTLDHMSLEANLRHALEHGEFRLQYQSRRDLATGSVSGVEALLCWEHPDLGTIPPSRFLPIAEESGAIVEIGRWMLRTACQESVALVRQGRAARCVAVALTPRQFHDEQLLDDVRDVLTQTGLEPWLLELEIPEGAVNQRPDHTRQRLRRLKEMGVRVALGDFGRSYASFASLGEFAFDTIKIDAALSRGTPAVGQRAGLLQAVIALGQRLGVTVVTPGPDAAEPVAGSSSAAAQPASPTQSRAG